MINRPSIVAILVAACAVTTFGAPVPFKTYERGQYSHIERMRQVIVRTESDWKMLARQRGPGDAPQTGQQAVDFSHSMIVGVFLGSRPTGGFGVEITTIERQGSDLVVTWRERKPGADEMAAQVITAPYHLVVLEKFDGPVKFVRGT